MTRVLRFLLVLLGGIALIWVLAIGPGGSLLGPKKPRIELPDAVARTPSAAADSGAPQESVSLGQATIPVREELKDRPGVKVLKYQVYIGQTVGGMAKRMAAKDVRIDIYNKKPAPDERAVARVHGSDSLLNFSTAPDPAGGFRDASIESMTLLQDVLVEYLDESGNTATTLRCTRLELSNDQFTVPDRAFIDQPGLHIEGDHLLYDKSTGGFSFEKNVVVEGTRFGLPESEGSAAVPGDDPAVAEVPKRIECAGGLTFEPAEEQDQKAPRARGKDGALDSTQLGSLSGGLLTFRDRVIGSQGDSKLYADRLEITLGKPDPSTVAATAPAGADSDRSRGKLDVRRVVATGTSEERARLVDRRGTLVGGTLTLEKTAAGQVVTMVGEPGILDGRLGDPADPEASKDTFTARAADSIRLHPAPVQTAASAPGDGAPAPETIVLELRKDGTLEMRGTDATKDFRIDGQSLDLAFDKSGSGAAETFALRELVATDRARATFASGDLSGDRIVATPRAGGAAGETSFAVTVTPNPSVNLASTDEETGVASALAVASPNGRLDYVPAAAAGEVTRADFSGPTRLTRHLDGALDTTLDASKKLTIELKPDAAEAGSGGLSSMTADGAVVFSSLSEGVAGRGEHLVLVPKDGGKQAFRLSGAPAWAKQDGGPSGENRELTASSIEFDPETNELHAVGSVEAIAAGLDLGAGIERERGAAADPNAAPGTLKCSELWIRSGEGDAPPRIEASGDVSYDDAARRLAADADRLVYDGAAGLVYLYGTPSAPARIEQTDAAKEGAKPSSVTVAGPELVLEQKTNVLTCARDGSILLTEPGATPAKDQRILARSQGPLRYANDRLVLQDEVVVTTSEGRSELRALWCDLLTAVFDEVGSDRGQKGSAATLQRILGEGRVHLEQTEPRALTAEGQTFEWLLGDEQALILRGTSPRCWIIGEQNGQRIRDEADEFRLYKDSERVDSVNGQSVYLDPVNPK